MVQVVNRYVFTRTEDETADDVFAQLEQAGADIPTTLNELGVESPEEFNRKVNPGETFDVLWTDPQSFSNFAEAQLKQDRIPLEPEVKEEKLKDDRLELGSYHSITLDEPGDTVVNKIKEQFPELSDEQAAEAGVKIVSELGIDPTKLDVGETIEFAVVDGEFTAEIPDDLVTSLNADEFLPEVAKISEPEITEEHIGIGNLTTSDVMEIYQRPEGVREGAWNISNILKKEVPKETSQSAVNPTEDKGFFDRGLQGLVVRAAQSIGGSVADLFTKPAGELKPERETLVNFADGIGRFLSAMLAPQSAMKFMQMAQQQHQFEHQQQLRQNKMMLDNAQQQIRMNKDIIGEFRDRLSNSTDISQTPGEDTNQKKKLAIRTISDITGEPYEQIKERRWDFVNNLASAPPDEVDTVNELKQFNTAMGSISNVWEMPWPPEQKLIATRNIVNHYANEINEENLSNALRQTIEGYPSNTSINMISSALGEIDSESAEQLLATADEEPDYLKSLVPIASRFDSDIDTPQVLENRLIGIAGGKESRPGWIHDRIEESILDDYIDRGRLEGISDALWELSDVDENAFSQFMSALRGKAQGKEVDMGGVDVLVTSQGEINVSQVLSLMDNIIESEEIAQYKRAIGSISGTDYSQSYLRDSVTSLNRRSAKYKMKELIKSKTEGEPTERQLVDERSAERLRAITAKDIVFDYRIRQRRMTHSDSRKPVNMFLKDIVSSEEINREKTDERYFNRQSLLDSFGVLAEQQFPNFTQRQTQVFVESLYNNWISGDNNVNNMIASAYSSATAH